MTDGGHECGGDWIGTALQRYEGPLLRYAAQITGDLDRARDVVQDTFLKLCAQEQNKIEQYLAEWLFRVCRNRALDVRRKEDRVQQVDLQSLEAYATEDPSPAVLAERQEAAGHVAQLLAQLPRNQQEVVRLKFQEGFRYDEISRITGLSVSNVGFLLHTALKTIRRELSALNAYENRT